MSKTAFLFPGQGAQKLGMGRDFYESDADSREVFDNAAKLLDLDMPKLCFEQEDMLNQTEYTQAAMVCTGIAILKAVKKTGLKADVCAGLSLGEYEALYLAGIISEDDAISLVRKRGIIMQQAVPLGVGAMAAVFADDTDKLEKIISGLDNVWIANYNCPGQTVLTGTRQAVEAASKLCLESCAKRVIPLNVSGPFHSPLLAEAAEQFRTSLDQVTFHKPCIPYVANYTGEYVDNEEGVRELLVKQLSGSVRFEQSIRIMLSNGVDTFIEIGPGRTLTGFVRKINRDVKTYTIGSTGELEAAAKEVMHE